MDIRGEGQRYVLAAFLVAGLVVGAGATLLATSMGDISKQAAGEKVVSTLESQSGQQLELVKVESENGLYRVDIKNQNNQLTSYYVTSNGKLLTPKAAVSDLEQINQAIEARNEFSSCLKERGVVLYGNLTQRATQLQIQVLGGTQVVAPIYSDINTPANLREAANRGVTNVPGFYYNGSVMSGISNLQQVEEFTGCQLQN